jgi:hypothetical protein
MIISPRAINARNFTFKQGILAGAAILAAFILMVQLVMWYIAAAILIAWTPFAYRYTMQLVKRDARLAIYFVFIALQSVHMMEHVAQMVQIHLLGRQFSASHGIFGAVMDTEWLHFLFDSLWIPGCMVYLLMLYGGRDRWLWILFPLAVWHCAEHVVIIDYYIRTGVVGSPGILASGGLIGSPLSRPDLHFLYNAVETWIMAKAFLARKGQVTR